MPTDPTRSEIGAATAVERPEDVVAADARAQARAAAPDEVELALTDVPAPDPAPDPAPGPAPVDPPEPAAPAAAKPASRRRKKGVNLREVRRQQTREAIVDAAAALFAERGFDHVSVLEIAQRAGVVEKTVFNHFPVKEGLVFEADPPMQAALLDAVRRRPAGESVAAAAGTFIVAACSRLGDPAAASTVAEMARVIRGSRTLQVREREILGQLTDALAEQITLETRAAPGELEPWLAAHSVLGLYQALLEMARDRVLSPTGGPAGHADLVAELRASGERGLSLLQFGLASYSKRKRT
ncbi:transcriptional regulator, TetR family [Klenkia soli]|uniref:Transcriptional regulator, TetR family n=1 Tax=Klenkia soli TaxID=1052260 RepID=A0A1H0GSF3_9ACTN|nr:TetR/AcrR family transcriptional regulator [Klenkia soli]SDO10006.1 transcriptional regulator, TetR family [Klenkia soli]